MGQSSLDQEKEPTFAYAKERYDVCKQCDKFQSTLKVCTQCGCFLPAKVLVKGSWCPQKKWMNLE